MESSEREILGENAYTYVEKNHAIPVLVDTFEKILKKEIPHGELC